MRRLRTISALAAVLITSLLALPTATSGGTSFGVADDFGKYADDGGATFFLLLNDIGFTQNRMTVTWDPTDGNQGLTIREGGFLDRALPVAAIRGVEVVLDVYPLRAKVFAVDTGKRIELFAQYLQLLARTYPQVTKFVVGNEPNQPRFHQPQFLPRRGGGYRATAGALYAHVLAPAYDALKAVNPKITVIGLGLSPRGNDDPRAKNNISRSPVRFIRDLALEYRRMGRTRPLMDELGFHPYPNSNDEPLARGHAWPNAGLANLGRIKQAVWDGFHGTAQPVFAETPLYGPPAPDPPPSLGLELDEYGRQVTIISSVARVYHGRENVPTISEGRQATIYDAVLRQVACDPAVSGFFYFHLVDDRDLDRFQSGLLRADGTKRPAYTAVKDALSATKGECMRAPRVWRHSNTVTGADVTFEEDGSLIVEAAEEAAATVGVVPAALTTANVQGALTRRLRSSRSQVRLIRAGRRVRVAVSLRGLAPGRYVRAVVLRATMNPERSFLALSEPVIVS